MTVVGFIFRLRLSRSRCYKPSMKIYIQTKFVFLSSIRSIFFIFVVISLNRLHPREIWQTCTWLAMGPVSNITAKNELMYCPTCNNIFRPPFALDISNGNKNKKTYKLELYAYSIGCTVKYLVRVVFNLLQWHKILAQLVFCKKISYHDKCRDISDMLSLSKVYSSLNNNRSTYTEISSSKNWYPRYVCCSRMTSNSLHNKIRYVCGDWLCVFCVPACVWESVQLWKVGGFMSPWSPHQQNP